MVARGVFGNRRAGGIQDAVPAAGMAGEEIEKPLTETGASRE